MILEVGLGGRLDATTVHPLRPLIAIAASWAMPIGICFGSSSSLTVGFINKTFAIANSIYNIFILCTSI